MVLLLFLYPASLSIVSSLLYGWLATRAPRCKAEYSFVLLWFCLVWLALLSPNKPVCRRGEKQLVGEIHLERGKLPLVETLATFSVHFLLRFSASLAREATALQFGRLAFVAMRRAAKTAAQGSHAEAVPAAAPANDDSQLNQAGTEGRAKESLAGLRNTLWKALFLPVALIIHVSGRAGLLVLTLGSIFCYLLDLFQLPEVGREEYCPQFLLLSF